MAFLVLMAAAGVLGEFALRPLGLTLSGVERIAFRWYVGLVLCAITTLVLGSYSLRLAQAGMILVAGGGLLLLWRYPRTHIVREASSPFSPLEWFCIAVLGVAFSLSAITALAPPTSWDAATAHLALPADYAREGRIYFEEGNAYGGYPHLLQVLTAYAYAQSGETTAALVSWAFGPLACAALYALTARLAGREAGLIAAAMLATAPIFFDQVGAFGIDMPYAGAATAALAAVFALQATGERGWAVLAGVLAGSAAGMRHTGYLTAALLLVGVLVAAPRMRWQAAAVFAVVTVVAAAPWLVRSALATGNPFHPFLAAVFAPGRWPEDQTTALLRHESVRGEGLISFLRFPWDVVMRPMLYDGWNKSPGGWVLILGIPGLLVGGARARWLGAYAIAGGVAFYFFQRFARYLLPFFLPAMAVAALAAVRLRPLRGLIVTLLVFGFLYGLALGGAAAALKLPVLVGGQSRDEFLAARVERYPAFLWANRNLGDDGEIFTLDPRSYYLEQPAWQNFEVLQFLRERPLEEQLDWLEAQGIRYIFYPRDYVAETPVFAAKGYDVVLNSWRADTAHFDRVTVLNIPRARGAGNERVEIYRVQYDTAGDTP